MRVSLIGGGSDYPVAFSDTPGYSVGFALNWFVYVSLSPLHPSASEKFRLTYRVTESVQHIRDIKHPTIRCLLEYLNWDLPISINTFADVPARNGLGGSSAFIAALSDILLSIIEKERNPKTLAELTVKIEREIAKEAGGLQDQYMTAFGHLRSYRFSNSGVVVSDPLLSDESAKAFGRCVFLTPLRALRTSDTATESQATIANDELARTKTRELARMAHQFQDYLVTNPSPEDIVSAAANVVTFSHKAKESFTNIPEDASRLIENLKKCGALASKICGSGGGGFILSIVPKEKIESFKLSSAGLASLAPGLSTSGTQLGKIGWN
jgi:D-glycero-alpha-D-manno-heptose-7-phosphate kinase